MRSLDRAAFLAAMILFVVFFANVSIGALNGAVFLGDVAEMATLLGASAAFVAGVLIREKQRASKPSENLN